MDTRQSLNEELKVLQDAIAELGRTLPQKGRDAAQARSNYELAKAKELIAMYKQETEGKFKRTIEQRTAIYREKFATERLDAYLAENEFNAEGSHLKALLGALTALQTRARLAEAEWKNGGYTQ